MARRPGTGLGPFRGQIGMDSRQRFRAGRPCPVCGGHAGMPRGEAALSSQPAQEALQDVAGHDTPAGVGRVPLETRLLQPPAGLPVGVTGETVQALARSEQVRRRLRHIWQMRTRAAQWGSTWTAPCLFQASVPLWGTPARPSAILPPPVMSLLHRIEPIRAWGGGGGSSGG